MKLIRFILALPIAFPLLLVGVILDGLSRGRFGKGLGTAAFWLLGILESVQ